MPMNFFRRKLHEFKDAFADGLKECQINYLSKPFVVWNRAHEGYAASDMAFIQSLTKDQQTKILSAHSAILGLTQNDQAKTAWEIVIHLEPVQRIKVLTNSALTGFCQHGYDPDKLLEQSELIIAKRSYLFNHPLEG